MSSNSRAVIQESLVGAAQSRINGIDSLNLDFTGLGMNIEGMRDISKQSIVERGIPNTAVHESKLSSIKNDYSNNCSLMASEEGGYSNIMVVNKRQSNDQHSEYDYPYASSKQSFQNVLPAEYPHVLGLNHEN